METTRLGKLFIVSTPIGNLEDITLRALGTLSAVQIIFAEDTRSALNLLKHHNINPSTKRIISFFEGNEQGRHEEIIKYLKEGIDVALISESGTPTIADPGFKLIRELVKEGFSVIPIPGATAAIAALTSSGLPTNSFLFLGFLPKKESHVKKVLEKTKGALETLKSCKTVILYESPHRLLKTLNNIHEVFRDIEIVVDRELTKIHEEVRREKVSISIEHFTKLKPRGELTILFSNQ